MADNTVDSNAQYRTGIETYRSVAKWVVSSFGVVAGALVVGVQLTSLSDIHGSRLIWCFISLGAVFGGVLAIVILASRLLAPMLLSYKDFGDARKLKSLHTYLEHDPSLLGDPSEGIATAQELAERYEAALADFGDATHAYQKSQTTTNESKLQEATEDRDIVRERVIGLTWLGRYLCMGEMFNRSMRIIFLCVAIAAGGTVAFAYFSSPLVKQESASKQDIHVSVGGPRLLDWPRSCGRLYFALGKLAQENPRVGPLWPTGSFSDWDRRCGLRTRADVARALAFLGRR